MKVMVVAGATYAAPTTWRLFEHLADRGVRTMLAMPARVLHPFAPAAASPAPRHGFTVEHLPVLREHHNGTHLVLRGLLPLVRRFDPDVIHCVMEPWGLSCLELAGYLALGRRRARFGIQAAETNIAQGSRVARGIRQMLYTLALTRCDYFVGWSEQVLAIARRRGFDGRPSLALPAVGVDMTLFRPATPAERRAQRERIGGLDVGDFVIGYVGRFVEEKGLVELIGAATTAARHNPRLRLVMVGQGPLEPWLRGLAASHGWLRVLGPSGHAGIAELMRCLDLFVLPSRTTSRVAEQFGLVLVEAMASGVPVIGSTCGAIPDVVGPGGWTVPERDAVALERLMLDLSSAREELRLRGLAAREWVASRFSAEAVGDGLSAIWRSVLDQSPEGRSVAPEAGRPCPDGEAGHYRGGVAGERR